MSWCTFYRFRVRVDRGPVAGNPGPECAGCAIANVSTFAFDHLHVLKPFVSGGMSKYLAIFAILLFCQLSTAQFGSFFEQMFQGEHPGRQQQRQRPPGADHWRAQADASESFPAHTGYITHTFLATSSLLRISLPRYPCMCRRTRAMPLPQRGRYQMCDPRHSRQDRWYGDLRKGCGLRRCRRLHERLVITLFCESR